jgi:hypothetical protein
VREIGLSNSRGTWRFGQRGKQLPFEYGRGYKAPRAQDRLTASRLVRYLAANGLRPFDDDFFVVDARHPAQSVTVTWTTRENPSVSLTELRERSGITPDVITKLLVGKKR